MTYQRVLLDNIFWSWTKEKIEIENSSNSTVGQSWQWLKGNICKKTMIEINHLHHQLSVFVDQIFIADPSNYDVNDGQVRKTSKGKDAKSTFS